MYQVGLDQDLAIIHVSHHANSHLSQTEELFVTPSTLATQDSGIKFIILIVITSSLVSVYICVHFIDASLR